MNTQAGNLKVDICISNTNINTHLAVVIPAFNEAQNIELVLNQIGSRAIAIVVDDGSTDGTAKLAKDIGAYVVVHETNKGYDAALETGILLAIELGCSYAVTLDADGQHDPTLLDVFNEKFINGADLIVGVRDCTQRWSETLFSLISRRIWGLLDPLCGVKGYRLSCLCEKKNLNTYRSIGTEQAIRLTINKVVPIQIDIKTLPRNGESRFGSGFMANLRILKALMIALLRFSFHR